MLVRFRLDLCLLIAVALLKPDGSNSFAFQQQLLQQSPCASRERCITSSTSSRSISEYDLESTFYLFDSDSNGEIDNKELAEALNNLGFSSTKSSDALFRKYDADGNGTIDFEEFKNLIEDDLLDDIQLPGRKISYAMDLFRKYDEDNSGSIDKTEFQNIAAEMQKETTRREVISVASAFIGALVVAGSSNEYLFAQKSFRGRYLEQEAEDAQKKFFPTAMLSSDIDKKLAKTLGARGFTPENTIFGHSVCSDEVNNRREQLIPLMIDRWEEGFSLGGLAGLPFAGKSGFGAYLHHVPDSGKLLVVFAPHVGIGADGRIGALQRDGQVKVSSACGAAVGAYKALQAKKKAPSDPNLSVNEEDTDLFDPQIKKIVELLAPKLKGIESSEDAIAFVTYQMYGIIKELIEGIIFQSKTDVFNTASEVAVCGGIMINRRKGGDFFQPLSFHSCTKDSSTDLFEKTFGPRPDLAKVLGSEDAASRLNTK